ncbi:MAG: DUF4160 domain-containing protein [Planctomycetota bacterium]
MARVECFSLRGVECVFYSNDHGEPHFHAIKRGCWEARIFFLRPHGEMVELKWARKRRSARDLKELKNSAAEFRMELIEEWETKVQR